MLNAFIKIPTLLSYLKAQIVHCEFAQVVQGYEYVMYKWPSYWFVYIRAFTSSLDPGISLATLLMITA